jgi:dTDP-4-amino-4,6-dideoxygalactose transaminase
VSGRDEPSARIPLLDLKAQFAAIETEVRRAIDEVLASQQFILGPAVAAFEAAIADSTGAAHAVGVSSGSDALLVSLMALDIGPGDEVVTSAYSFFASAGAVARLGARPVFVDIEPDTYNIDATLIEGAITPRTKAILPVHLFGQCADMSAILAIADYHGLPVVEDAAQAIGAEYRGRRAGSMGKVGCLSFFPSKNLGGFGDGGMAVTADGALAEKIRVLRGHGAKPKYHHGLIGGNFRLDALQAAVLAAKLPHLEKWTEARRKVARFYDRKFAAAGLAPARLITPAVRPGRHVFHQYVIRTPKRDALLGHLKEQGIGCAVYYPEPLHLQACFVDLGYREGQLPNAEAAARESLAVPMYPELTESQIDRVVATIAAFHGAR